LVTIAAIVGLAATAVVVVPFGELTAFEPYQALVGPRVATICPAFTAAAGMVVNSLQSVPDNVAAHRNFRPAPFPEASRLA
jgi:hypothetical protein